jgi:hypothetical protein
MSIMPGTVEQHGISWIEIGTFVGSLGLFALIVGMSLAKIPIIPKNHPYLIESTTEEH